MKNNANKIITKLAYNNVAQQYYDEYHNDNSDLSYFDQFLVGSGKKILDLGCGMGHYYQMIIGI